MIRLAAHIGALGAGRVGRTMHDSEEWGYFLG